MKMKGIPPRYDSASWEAEDDARTLARAEEIKSDKERLEKAQTVAQKLREEKEQEARAMAKITNSKISYDRSPKPPQKEAGNG